ncbi:MAG: hypothetical protein KH382_04110 [Clostridiales bacterium]|jgi:hypothetical protein|nr:hypothetical protein [Clostridiales bacterium]
MKKSKPNFLEYIKKANPNGAFEIKQVFYNNHTGQKMKMNIKHKSLFYVINALVYFSVFLGLVFVGFKIGNSQNDMGLKILYYIGDILVAVLLVLLIDAIKYVCINFEFIKDETITKQE